jgi:modification methylase
VSAARERIDAVTPHGAGAVQPLASRKSEPRIAFGLLVEAGILRPGEALFDAKATIKAQIMADGSLDWRGVRGSIHAVGAKAQGRAACNGWTYWHFRDEASGLRPIDALRDRLRKESGRGLSLADR